MDVKKQLEAIRDMDEANERRVEEFKQEDKILAVYVDVYGKGRATKKYIKPDLDEYYRLLDCTCIDMPTRWIGGKPFIIICDDEGMFRSDRKVSAVDANGEPALVGNLLVVAFDGREDVRGLTDDEADMILVEHVTGRGRMDKRGRTAIWEVLKDVQYTRRG